MSRYSGEYSCGDPGLIPDNDDFNFILVVLTEFEIRQRWTCHAGSLGELDCFS